MSQKHTSWVVKKNEINAVVTRWGAITPQADVIRLRELGLTCTLYTALRAKLSIRDEESDDNNCIRIAVKHSPNRNNVLNTSLQY